MPEQQLATVFRRFLKRAKEALGLASRKTAVGRETAYFVMQSTDGRFAAREQVRRHKKLERSDQTPRVAWGLVRAWSRDKIHGAGAGAADAGTYSASSRYV